MEIMLVYFAIAALIASAVLAALTYASVRKQANGTSDQALESMRATLAELSHQADKNHELQMQRIASLEQGVVQVRGEFDALRAQTAQQMEANRLTVDAKLGEVRGVVDDKLTERLGAQTSALLDQLKAFDARFQGFQAQTAQGLKDNADAVGQRLAENTSTADKRLAEVRTTLENQLKTLQADNNTQLERMRQTVDEKLQKTLNDRITQSFQLVNESLDKVGRGLGEMQTLAQDVGGLKRVLGNVKSRGIVGEIQLGAILKEILSPTQYEEDIATVPGSANRVEFAVKMPGDNGETVYLPIDSKFPGDSYEHLREALDAGDADAAAAAWKVLEARIKQEAKDIREKYVEPPATTGFGIMFLPFEGLYAEVVNRPGLLEELQRAYRVNVAGPSTMAALLNSLQMGFQTVAIQKRAGEIQTVLAAVKTEFSTYQSMLVKAQKQLGTASKTVDLLVGRRARAMERKLRDITELGSAEEAERILGLGEFEDDTENPALDANDAASGTAIDVGAAETGEE